MHLYFSIFKTYYTGIYITDYSIQSNELNALTNMEFLKWYIKLNENFPVSSSF